MPAPALPYGPWLVLDTASPEAVLGLWQDGAWRAVRTHHGDALAALGGLVAPVLAEAQVGLGELAGFACAEGPGSVLGLRLAVTTLRTWQAFPELAAKPVRCWNRLALAAAAARARSGGAPCTVLTDYRQRAFLAWVEGPGGPAPVRAVAPADLDALPRPLWHLPQRKGWNPPPADAQLLDLGPAELAARLAAHWFAVDEPRVYAPAEAAEYVRWAGGRHRAPSDHAAP